MFYITIKKGFHITFENGYNVSVQFGPANYCDHYNRNIGIDEEDCGKEGSGTAECAVWKGKSRDMIEHPLFSGNTVGGYMSPAQVLELLNWASTQ